MLPRRILIERFQSAENAEVRPCRRCASALTCKRNETVLNRPKARMGCSGSSSSMLQSTSPASDSHHSEREVVTSSTTPCMSPENRSPRATAVAAVVLSSARFDARRILAANCPPDTTLVDELRCSVNAINARKCSSVISTAPLGVRSCSLTSHPSIRPCASSSAPGRSSSENDDRRLTCPPDLQRPRTAPPETEQLPSDRLTGGPVAMEQPAAWLGASVTLGFRRGGLSDGRRSCPSLLPRGSTPAASVVAAWGHTGGGGAGVSSTAVWGVSGSPRYP
mmetsp:Transcript_33795/g.77211  ORF Transcript_33795/g.77211 Transcript_33795/m.77211 type:complete len:279 (-) Transcript_33795:1338-2174(-)